MEAVLLVLTNLPDAQSAQDMARQLVEQKLAACVSCLPGVHSIYRWQGAIEQADEVTLLMKVSESGYPMLESAIRSTHPYEVPEIIALPIQAGFPAYLQWVIEETQKDPDV